MALPVFKIGRCPFGGRLGSTPRRFRHIEIREDRAQGDQGDQGGQSFSGTASGAGRAFAFEAALGQAARLAVAGAHAEAAHIVDQMLAVAPAGNAAWLLPIEPLLHVAAKPDCWARPLARLRNRAA